MVAKINFLCQWVPTRARGTFPMVANINFLSQWVPTRARGTYPLVAKITLCVCVCVCICVCVHVYDVCVDMGRRSRWGFYYYVSICACVYMCCVSSRRPRRAATGLEEQ